MGDKADKSDFAALFTPFRLAGKTLRNRITHASITTLSTPEGRVTDREVLYHANRAAGGVALSVTEPLGMMRHQARLPRIQVWRQDDLDGLNYLYPACANVPHAPSCTSRSGGRATALRFLQVRAPSAPQPRPRAIARLRPVHVSQSFFVIYLIPLCVFAGLKIFALIVVFTQEQLAKRKLAGATKELLSGGGEKGGEDNLPEPGNTFLDRAAERMREANDAQGRGDGATARDGDR